MKHVRTIIVVLVLTLASTIVIGSATVMIDNSRFLRAYLSSEITVEGRAEFNVPVIVGALESRVYKGQSMLGSRVETIPLFTYGSDRGYFEGMSYNRYLDISSLWLQMEWEEFVTENFTMQYIMEVCVNASDGERIWDIHNDTWTFGWMWDNFRSYSRPQDQYLYDLRTGGYFLLGGINGFLLFQIIVGAFERRRRKNKITTSRSVLG